MYIDFWQLSSFINSTSKDPSKYWSSNSACDIIKIVWLLEISCLSTLQISCLNSACILLNNSSKRHMLKFTEFIIVFNIPNIILMLTTFVCPVERDDIGMSWLLPNKFILQLNDSSNFIKYGSWNCTVYSLIDLFNIGINDERILCFTLVVIVSYNIHQSFSSILYCSILFSKSLTSNLRLFISSCEILILFSCSLSLDILELISVICSLYFLSSWSYWDFSNYMYHLIYWFFH